MKWVTVGKGHWNTDNIEAFYWADGRLCVHWHDREENSFESYRDPDRAMYKRLCLCVGVAPLEVSSDGKS